jgi:GxxExxY protein
MFVGEVRQGFLMADDKLLHPELSHAIIGSAMEVLNTLKPGLDEKAYENALAVELRSRGFSVEQQRRFDIFFKRHLVDTLIPDLIVEGCVIVDPKVTEEFNAGHLAQMTGYLTITELRLAILLNFKHGSLR